MSLESKLLRNFPLASLSSMHIGGNANYFLRSTAEDDLIEGVRFAGEKDLPFIILGGGTNVLIHDRGHAGVVLRVAHREVAADGDRLTIDAGAPMAFGAARAAALGLSGFEWAIGIPGTVGGSVRGNAGCFGGEMKDVVETVRYYDAEKDEIAVLANSECEFGYRTSIFKKHPERVVLSATLKLEKGETSAIQEKIKGYSESRTGTQPIGKKSAGCIFKNISWQRRDIDQLQLISKFPEFAAFTSLPGIPAAYCIDAVGLKGKKVGGASISTRHANYFLNNNDATAEDIVMLIAIAKEYVHRKFRLQLEEEVQYVGFDH